MIRGLIFDLDGTLADSKLDFEAMRREMQLPPHLPILEAIVKLPPVHAARCQQILREHEFAGANRASLLPGVSELFKTIETRGLRRAIATRNSRQVADATLKKLGIRAEMVLTRDCGPVKPDPWAVHQICQAWGTSPREVAVIGDYRFDIECGRAAGCHTVLLVHPQQPGNYPNTERADLVLSSLADYPLLLAWLDSL